MSENNFEKFKPAFCPIRHVLDRFGDKWSILVVELLSHKGKMRFSEIATSIGDISQKMLTVTLRSLEADGLISREFYPEIPPRVEYELTQLGKSLIPPINNLLHWGQEHLETILGNRKRYEDEKEKKKQAGSY
ncbi:helix-turn-helix domain-containing protein [[Flexibacter] sp. ATCC 35208]|uniref:winged helix-turn-helix transcriptional regulator n=1 Tax=[Flexibacter] sp. ATCC 35208 TaxID=1936242 RepID=UPI0009D16284|nr:helix-turn-helix domain-containing protein [[Flexibacter] sp. ATCC 35208]OMP77758.1 transcriptional regulator [[Flexibacter] sp. ATCC 35208]